MPLTKDELQKAVHANSDANNEITLEGLASVVASLQYKSMAEGGFGYAGWLLMLSLFKELINSRQLTPEQIRAVVQRARKFDALYPLLDPQRMHEHWELTLKLLALDDEDQTDLRPPS